MRSAQMNAALPLAILASLCGISRTVARTNRYLPVPVVSCLRADSLLGPLGTDVKGRVFGYYDSLVNRSFLSAHGPLDLRWTWFNGSLTFWGAGPATTPGLDLLIDVGGQAAERLAKVPDLPPPTVVLDDSTDVSPDRYFRGDSGSLPVPRFPLNASFPPTAFGRIVTATDITVQIEDERLQLSDQDRVDLRALYRVAVCQTFK